VTRRAPHFGVQEGRSWLTRGIQVDAPVLVTDLPPAVPFGFLGRVLPTSEPVELRLTLRKLARSSALSVAEKAAAIAEADLETRVNSPGARPSELRHDAESARELAARVAARDQDLWRVGLSFHALARGRGNAEEVRSHLIHRLHELGFRARLPTFETGLIPPRPDPSELAPRPVGYWHTLATDAVAALFPFVEESVLEPGGILLGLLLQDANPVFLNRWAHGSYSWGIFGCTGSGKSFAAALWSLRTRWRSPETVLLFVDPLGEFTGLTRALGGSVIPVGPGGRERLNPLDPVTTGGDRDAKAARVGTMLRALFPSLTDADCALLDSRLSQLFREGQLEPRWSDLLDAIAHRPGAERLNDLLEVFRAGSLQYLDGPTTVSLEGSPLALDLHSVPPEQMPFHLTYALDALTARLRADDRPKLLVVDEAHYLVRHPATAEFLDQLVRHVRHYRAGLLLLSQNPDDFLATPAGRSLLRNLRATVLLRLSEVSTATRDFFQLTAAEADWLPKTRLPVEAGYSEGLLRFGAGHLPLAIIASTPEFEWLGSLFGSGGASEPSVPDSPRTARLSPRGREASSDGGNRPRDRGGTGPPAT
jgi:conjugal transfer ATP-binding protein TraC